MKLRCLAITFCWVLVSAAWATAQMPPLPGFGLDLHALFSIVGRMYGIDPSLLEAVAVTESAEDPSAVSPKGAQGLMQLMPSTAERFGVVDPLDPVESALGAARFLHYLGRIEGVNPGALPRVLAAYNAGENAVQRHNGIPPFEETEDYVRRVLWLYLFQAVPAPLTHRYQPFLPKLHRPPIVSRTTATTATGDAAILQQLSGIRRARTLAEETR